jgi:hypothetical protein
MHHPLLAGRAGGVQLDAVGIPPPPRCSLAPPSESLFAYPDSVRGCAAVQACHARERSAPRGDGNRLGTTAMCKDDRDRNRCAVEVQRSRSRTSGRHPRRVVQRELLQKVWGPDTRPRPTTYASTWPNFAANSKQTRPSRNTCSPNRAWDTASSLTQIPLALLWVSAQPGICRAPSA